MDQTNQPNQPLPQPASPQEPVHTGSPATNPTSEKPNKKSSKTALKILIGVIVGATLLLAGFYFGMMRKPANTSPTPTPQATKQEVPSPTAMIEKSASPSAGAKKTVMAGLTGSSVFKTYSIEVPAGWTDTRDSQTTSDKLTLAKNNYSLTITQAAFGGGGCIYKGDPPAEMSQSFTDFSDISAGTYQFRRSWNQGTDPTISYTICQKSSTENSYGSITSFGHIDATSPNPSDQAIMAEIDSMISSIKKQ